MNRLYTLQELNKITEVINSIVHKNLHYVEVEPLLNPKNGYIVNGKLTLPNNQKFVLDLSTILKEQ